jgi:hypothetical protein
MTQPEKDIVEALKERHEYDKQHYPPVDPLFMKAALEIEQLRRFVRQRDRLAANSRKYWIRDAKEALNGDVRALRNRVDMAEADPVDVVPS